MQLYLELHGHRYDFSYKVSTSSAHWESGWPTVMPGFSERKQRSFNPTLSDKAIKDLLFGKETNIHNGNKNVRIGYASCRFGKYTRYFAIDIDNEPENKYYNIETIHKILEITKNIGAPLLMQSSYSKGWHLRWYFTESIKTWDVAIYIHNLFTENGFVISDGKFELYPNRKSEPHALYRGLRLPCQKGSALLSLEDGRVVASPDEDPEIFIIHWAEEVRKNLIDISSLEFLNEKKYSNPNTQGWYERCLKAKEVGFTGPSQTNKLLGAVADYYRVFNGISDVSELTKILCNWIDEKHNGFSDEYNHSPKSAYYWCKRWAICAIKNRKPLSGVVVAKKENNHNKAKGGQYDHQLSKCIQDGVIKDGMSVRKIERLTGIPKSAIGRRLKSKVFAFSNK
ncbi:MAG: hypothetical protein HY094_05385 [Candidatus Melainabacteria bacterium]|nr:hypothetical protein [Candidatus Melainabacteria bacterium]